jgi:aryl-alcohol dehydrogenase-like predicted oxidoreductase
VDGNPGGVAEEIVGRWLAQHSSRRDKVILATKVRGPMGPGPNDQGLSRRQILSAVENSLRRLNVDTIDLYQLHYPDEETPIEETLSALENLIQRGLIRYIGCSNFAAWRLVEALWISAIHGHNRFVSLQPHYNLVHREEYERELLDVCRNYKVAVMPYSPLAGGFLTEKGMRAADASMRSGESLRGRATKYQESPHALETLRSIAKIAERHKSTISQVSLAWLSSQPTITSLIIGPRSIDQLVDNLGALLVELLPDEFEMLDNVSHWSN